MASGSVGGGGRGLSRNTTRAMARRQYIRQNTRGGRTSATRTRGW